MITPQRWSWWPDAAQTLLLRAGLARGNTAVDAWRAWLAMSDLGRIDLASQRLLPLVYRNLTREGVTGPPLPRLKGVYRATWYKNQVLLHHAAGHVKALEAAGIATLVLKGAALTTLYYQDPGLRPMDDFDLLVSTDRARDAIRLLTTRGLRSATRAPERLVRLLHSCDFNDADGYGFDLHWYALRECRTAGIDADFWRGAVPLRIGDVSTRTLCAADQLLVACLHGALPGQFPTIRWIADALTVIRVAGPALDWDRLVAQAQGRGVTLSLYEALCYLRTRWNAPVPDDALQALRQTPHSRLEWLDQWYRTRRARGHNAYLAEWYHYLRQRNGRPLGRHIAGFPGYLQAVWDLDEPWWKPRQVVARAAKRLQGHE